VYKIPEGIVETLSTESLLAVLNIKALATPKTQLVSGDEAIRGKTNNLFL
jgi:hypothetical protein